MAYWLERLAYAPTPFLVLAAVLAVAAFVAGLTGLRRVRHIEDVPTARVRSAPQGYVELIGRAHAMDGEPIIAPLSQTPCCWYRFRVERADGKDWRTVDSGVSDGIFLLRDETGECVVDPRVPRSRPAISAAGPTTAAVGVRTRCTPAFRALARRPI